MQSREGKTNFALPAHIVQKLFKPVTEYATNLVYIGVLLMLMVYISCDDLSFMKFNVEFTVEIM